MTNAELQALGDPFASLLLARGKIPRSGEELVELIKAAVPAKDRLRHQKSFILGEGSQLPSTKAGANVDRSLRFLVTLGSGLKGPDVFLSTGRPEQRGGVEVMAWDRRRGGFNFYRSTGTTPIWMFAGNSRDALHPASRGKGPFESHPTGNLLMKELKIPWNNWHSFTANIPPTAFQKGDRRRTHRWFTEKDSNGAATFEVEAAMPAITRWTKVRFENMRKRGNIARPAEIMEQILGTPTVNLVTSNTESGAIGADTSVDLPGTFFVDADGLGRLGLQGPDELNVKGPVYAKCLKKFEVHLADGNGFEQKGDTHFCFLVPERAFEDQEALQAALDIGLLTPRLAACLLMVDPWNPVFSDRRRSLLRHVPRMATFNDGKTTFAQEMKNAILAAAKNGPPGTPEAEFAERWGVGPGFASPFNKILRRYYAAVKRQLKSQAGFEPYFKLAEERRKRFKESMPIAQEFPLLLPRTNITVAGRRMEPDGTVSGA
jgi:hypothetical protein